MRPLVTDGNKADPPPSEWQANQMECYGAPCSPLRNAIHASLNALGHRCSVLRLVVLATGFPLGLALPPLARSTFPRDIICS